MAVYRCLSSSIPGRSSRTRQSRSTNAPIARQKRFSFTGNLQTIPPEPSSFAAVPAAARGKSSLRGCMSYDPERRRSLAEGLKSARRRAGISSAAAAARLSVLGLKCTRGALLAWERGSGRTSREPFASDIGLFAALYDCSVADIYLPPPPTSAQDKTETTPAGTARQPSLQNPAGIPAAVELNT